MNKGFLRSTTNFKARLEEIAFLRDRINTIRSLLLENKTIQAYERLEDLLINHLFIEDKE
jgi:hypothetical protein